MSMNFKTRKNPNKSPEKEELGFKIIFFALNILLVPFSTIATFKGYRGFLDDYLAIVLAAATGLMFFGLNYIIMERRRKGEGHLKQVLGFLIPLLISFFGNFTYFYGNQMQGTLLNKDLTAFMTTMDQTYQSAKTQLENSSGLGELESKLNAELELLKLQISGGTGAAGCGQACEKKWQDIIELFRVYNNKHNQSATTSMTQVYDKSYNNFENVALSYFNSIKTTKENEIENKLKEINNEYLPLKEVSDSLLKTQNQDALKLNGVDVIKKISQANNFIGERSKGFLGNDFEFKKLAEYDPVDAKNIKSVLESAFIKKDNQSATVFSVIMSLVIDLATLVFVFLAISFNVKKRKKGFAGPRQL